VYDIGPPRYRSATVSIPPTNATTPPPRFKKSRKNAEQKQQ
jgi:hypothetical protein